MVRKKIIVSNLGDTSPNFVEVKKYDRVQYFEDIEYINWMLSYWLPPAKELRKVVALVETITESCHE